MKFDLQLFGGKGSSQTTNNNYRPLTEDEKRMQKLSTNYAEHIQPSAYNLYDNAISGLNNTLNPSPNYNELYNNQRQATNENRATAKNLSQGILPQAYVDNRNAQAQRYAKSAFGDLLANNVSNGVVNSSIMTKGMNDLSTNLANKFQDSFTNDLGTASNMLTNKQNYDNMGIQQANQAEQASYQMPLQLLAASQGQFQPTTQIWQPTLMSNQANPISSTTTQSGGDLFSGIASGVGSFYGACFPADTMVTTPEGDKPIQDIKVGDLVYSINENNRIIIEKVLTLSPLHKEFVTKIVTNDGSFYTTDTQFVLTKECDLISVSNLQVGDTLFYLQGNKIVESPITEIIRKEYATQVYDFTTNHNFFFANGFIVEGYFTQEELNEW